MRDDAPAPGHIHRTRLGEGARQVLAIHCTLAHSGAWRGLAAALGLSDATRARVHEAMGVGTRKG